MHGFIIGFLASTKTAHHFKWPQLGRIPCQVVGFQSLSAISKTDEEPLVSNPRPGARSAKALAAVLRELQEHGSKLSQEPFVVDCSGRTVNVMHD